ncbi:hypothetical protein X777_00171 [Ooceraea biroi]|uniref:Uncharacterized protein n=1 Tax=Ooceraea biroi TaxID=2015173 RepID=A0A026VSC9_OOCBI|nr:hypothetical protein X777_00171 [Ooceraea biroi]
MTIRLCAQSVVGNTIGTDWNKTGQRGCRSEITMAAEKRFTTPNVKRTWREKCFNSTATMVKRFLFVAFAQW